jgi:hypothetical protein
MVLFEKHGVPTVCIASRGFEQDAARSAQSFGLPLLPVAVVSDTITNRTEAAIGALIRESFDQLVVALTQPISDSRIEVEKLITVIDDDWLSFEGSDLLHSFELMNRRFLEYGWGDGFPLIPATEQALEKMMSGTRRAPEDLIAVLEPGFGKATVEKIAANAVMAGCRPEHLPVVIAAVECIAEPKISPRMKQMSTGPHAAMVIVNGPIRGELGINSGRCALGPGAPSAVNTAIGRAVRLCQMNIGLSYAGVSDMDTIGTALKYSQCVAENEEMSPWDPYHVDRGFEPDQSTVTVQFTEGFSELKDFRSTTPDALIRVFATSVTNVAHVATGMWLQGRRSDPRHGTNEKEHHLLFIAPDHAGVFRDAGWSRSDVQQAMYAQARMSFETLMLTKEPESFNEAHPELAWLWDSPETLLPVLEDPECYEVAVVGGPAGRGEIFLGAGGPITKEIQR